MSRRLAVDCCHSLIVVYRPSHLGYVLTTRVLRTHLSKRFDLEVHLRIEPGILARRHLRLRLWRLTADGELDESDFPAYVDVFPYVLDGRDMHILDKGHRLPLQCGLAITASLYVTHQRCMLASFYYVLTVLSLVHVRAPTDLKWLWPTLLGVPLAAYATRGTDARRRTGVAVRVTLGIALFLGAYIVLVGSEPSPSQG